VWQTERNNRRGLRSAKTEMTKIMEKKRRDALRKRLNEAMRRKSTQAE
jgi:hypothetical protein